MKKIIIILIISILFAWYLFYFHNWKNFYTIPSDKNIFTQGIFIKNNTIFISGGAPSKFPQSTSSVGIINSDGKFQKKFQLDSKKFFWEWITELNGKIYFITWKNQKGFILDEKNFAKISEFTYENTEGWWLTSDHEKIFMSDGSGIITIFDENFEKISEFTVTENNKVIHNINELEFIDGFLFANIWLTNDIIKINPQNGQVLKRWNFNFLFHQEWKMNPNRQEMNGIAFHKEKNEILLTWKLWENIYIFPKKYFQ